jgi:hypothetical protein
MNVEKEWQRLKEQYLKQIEDALVDSGQPNIDGIVNDVRGHLDRRFAELPAGERTWENFQKIITDMGPPSDYAELVSEKGGTGDKKISTRYVITLAVILAVLTGGLFLLPALLPKCSLPTWTDKMGIAFAAEPKLVGEWVSVDFVSEVNEFKPGSKRRSSELFLKDVAFYPDGTTNKSWTWTKGWLIHGDSRTKAEYKVVEISGSKYLFLPWLSGDVTIRKMKPKYYVLKKVSETVAPQKTGQQADEQTITAAIEAAKTWLKLVDEGAYEQSWTQAAKYFRNNVSEQQWTTSLSAVRRPLGKVLSRKIKTSTYTTETSGAPDGRYVIIQFDTSFENKQNAAETITPMLDSDNKWRVSGYYIK